MLIGLLRTTVNERTVPTASKEDKASDFVSGAFFKPSITQNIRFYRIEKAQIKGFAYSIDL
jgi:hypothetical protein